MTNGSWLSTLFQRLAFSTATPRARGRRPPPRHVPMVVALLESRVFLSATIPETAAAPTTVDPIDDGVVILRTRTDASEVAAPAEGSLRPNAQLNGNGLQFNLIAASGMSQQAIDGFQAAADLWSSFLRDDILVNINIDFTTLGAGILGSTGSTSQGSSLSSVKTALANDATSLSDATAVANLPAGSTLSIYTSDATTGAAEIDNNGTANNITLDINTANAKALGLRSASDAAADGSITFSSSFTWDFDRSNGITAGAYDFIGVAAHEIGHLLGFVSGADTVDYASLNGSGAPLELDPYRVVTPLDLFRRSAASETAGTDIDLRADTATKYFSIDGGTTQLTTFSTGVDNGDGRQCSHWKDNLNIGIMDPTASNGEYTDITNLDVQAFDVMGWNVAMDLGDAPDTGASTGTGNYQTNLSDGGARHMLFSASGSISDPSGAPKVYLGAGVTGELTALQNSTATGDVDNGISSLPTLVPGTTQNFTVNSTGNNAILNYFFDFNRDGDFADGGEAFSTTLTSTSQSLSVTVPALASLGTTFARFRVSTAGGLTATGAANDGEVEDYQVQILAPLLSQSGPAVTFINKQSAVIVVPQVLVPFSNLANGVLTISVNAVG
ncbi:MAG: NF038122 family metalloprotease, partial [Planctomycetaceae bacterium]|nr:NF038122 family metalloprotease [Planctomycetaceae bacterium]